MKLKELLALDLDDIKSIDKAQIKEALLGKPDILIIVGIIIFTLIAVIGINSKYALQKKTAQGKVRQLEAQLKEVDENKVIQRKYAAFMDSFPEELPEKKLNEKLSEFAVKNNVQIKSFSPAKEKQSGYVKVSNIQINVLSDDYQSLIQFIKDIETAPYAIHVESWRASAMANPKSKTQPIKQVDITIGATRIE